MESDGKYFNDMWLALEKELGGFDSYIKDTDWMNSNSSESGSDSSPQQELENNNLSVETYEQLLNLSHDDPSSQALRSKSRSERIEAVRQLYNQVPTIINASSIVRLQKVVKSLYRTGAVKAANALTDKINQSFQEVQLTEEVDSGSKSLDVANDNGNLTATVHVDQRNDNGKSISIEKTFDNIVDALEFYVDQ